MKRTFTDNGWSPPRGYLSVWILPICLLLIGPVCLAERPRLRPAPRSELAGRIIVVPPPRLPLAIAQLKLLAEIADHELIVPPARTLDSPDQLADWVLARTGIEADGLILSRGSIDDQLIEAVRRERPRLPIEVVDDQDDLSLVVTRLITHRLGEALRIYPVYSTAGSGGIRRTIERQIGQADLTRTTGGEEIGSAQRPVPAPPDLLLFVHLPGTTVSERERMLEVIGAALTRNGRVAIVDLVAAGTVAPLFTTLRERRWLDRLASFAAINRLPYEERETAAATARAISQAALFVIGIRALRDDVDRLFRMERAQVRLLFSRYLSDYLFPTEVRDELPPATIDTPTRERTALTRLQPLATALFNEQFRRNIHATRLPSGDRAQFQLALLQQLRVRLLTAPVPVVEIIPAIHLAWLGNLSRATTRWELADDEIDPRLINRWLKTDWERFTTDAERIRVTFRITKNGENETDEGYRIRSRRSRGSRRIEITAATISGVSYAITRLAQLGAAGALKSDLDLAEAPRTTTRGVVDDLAGAWSLRERLDLLEFLGRQRFNRYRLILPPESPALPPPIIDQLRRAAAQHAIELTVERRPPLEQVTSQLQPLSLAPGVSLATPALYPADQRLCLSLFSGFDENLPADAILFHLPAHAVGPYSLWPRLAAAAEMAWSRTGYRPEVALDNLLAGEDPAITTALRRLVTAPEACRPDATSLPLTDYFMLATGRRHLALLKGELRTFASSAAKP